MGPIYSVPCLEIMDIVVATITCSGPRRWTCRSLGQWVGWEVPNIPTPFPSPGQGSDGSFPEVLQAPVGGTIQVQCPYRPQDIKARKVWCQVLPEGCQPLVSSAVDRRAPGPSRVSLTDLGSGLLQVQMVDLREEDAGEYSCVVEAASGPQTVHRIALDILPAGEKSQAGHLSSDGPSPPQPAALGSLGSGGPLWGRGFGRRHPFDISAGNGNQTG